MSSIKTDNNAYELFPNYVPRPPLPRKVGGHDPQLLWERRPWLYVVLICYCDFASVEVVIKNYLLTYLLTYLQHNAYAYLPVNSVVPFSCYRSPHISPYTVIFPTSKHTTLVTSFSLARATITWLTCITFFLIFIFLTNYHSFSVSLQA